MEKKLIYRKQIHCPKCSHPLYMDAPNPIKGRDENGLYCECQICKEKIYLNEENDNAN